MRLDGRRYAAAQSAAPLPYPLFETGSALYNTATGFDMVYQDNKVFNLKLAAQPLDGLLIRPGETFSFWGAVRHANRRSPYRDGLSVENGRLTTAPGGGLCQMSNLLFSLFLHAPLTVVERHGHDVKDFPTPRQDEPEGLDATVYEGWLDLKVKNESADTFQIGLAFDAENLYGTLRANRPQRCRYDIAGRDLRYFRRGDAVFQHIAIVRRQVGADDGKILSEEPLYENICEIGYPLPADTPILGMEDDTDG